ncbi:hypothetical protein L0B52_06200 [Suttonella sp. R2A3]|uniref:hypothetical protein n=1 Tax=Suttonella sp. R2A3 TaxID=2908648 RepID=UPI001F1CF5F0|nr:hypothetical protein [Suttonella sp. R2A3]UJF23933.1 hypothetical protein L0B52_06200 [Suttonella sp. R2A3]
MALFIMLCAYVIAWQLSNYLIKTLVSTNNHPSSTSVDVNRDGDIDQKDQQIIRNGYIIGKCENLIIVTLVLSDAITGLALIFAAKNLVRQEDIKRNAGFFLVGTMVNFTASLMVAFIAKYVISLVS